MRSAATTQRAFTGDPTRVDGAARLGFVEGLQALRRGPAAAAIALLVLVLGLSAFALHHSQNSAKVLVGQRYRTKVDSASALVATFVSEEAPSMRATASQYLSGSRVTPQDMAAASRDLGSLDATIVNSQGRAIESYPTDPSLVGAEVASRDTYLQEALGGKVGVSDLVASAAPGHPVFTVAVPVEVGGQKWAFAAGYDVHSSPLSAYIASSFPPPTAATYLLDSDGNVIASSASVTVGGNLLGADPALAGTFGHQPSGTYHASGADMYFAGSTVAGTPWRLVAVIPLGSLRASLGSQWIPWALLSGLAAAGLIALLFLGRLIAGLDRIAVALVNSQELEAQKTQFIASVSHDLRTPLTSIVGYTHLLATSRREPPSEDQASMLAAIAHSAARLGLLIDDLLTVSQMQSGHFSITPVRVELVQVICEVVTTIRPLAEQAGVTLDVSLPEQPVAVRADLAQLERALLNLATNAVKFTPATGRVELCLTTDGKTSAAVVVSDTGIGIPADELDSIFDRFYRASSVKNHAIPGTGLGLAITKTIVELHGGHIVADSDPGAGTRMTVILPLDAPVGDDRSSLAFSDHQP